MSSPYSRAPLGVMNEVRQRTRAGLWRQILDWPRLSRPTDQVARLAKALKEDALELTRSEHGEVCARAVASMVLTSDSYRVLVLQRLREAARGLRIPLGNHVLRVAQTSLLGVEIGKQVELGRGVYFVHSLGTVIGGDAQVGQRVRFYGNNTVGTAKDNGFPTIEDDVWVGAGARILGPITVGARSRIGANAVVLQDVPPDSVAVGIPARILPRRDAADSGPLEPLRSLALVPEMPGRGLDFLHSVNQSV